jgi:glycine dehydrogenase subunit 2
VHLPELSELDVVRHYTRLSQHNYSIDTNFYPLGSCTMKYNPRINEEIAQLAGFAATHPLQYQYLVRCSRPSAAWMPLRSSRPPARTASSPAF